MTTMMKPLMLLIPILTALLFPHAGSSQGTLPLKVGLLAEQISLPSFQQYGNRLGYGISAGSEYRYAGGSKTDLAQTADFSFVTHKQYGTSLNLASLFVFRYKPGRVRMEVGLGPGFMLFSNYSSVYKEVNGAYEEKSSPQGKFTVTASLSVSYQLKQVTPFVSYGLLAESPFINSSSSILPHQTVGAGVLYNLKIGKHEK
jgi:hypothetical protein